MNVPRADGERTRRRILATALVLFREQGFLKTTMRQIAAETGLSLGAAYHHFDSKHALVAAYYEDRMTAHARAARAGWSDVQDPRERLRIVMHTALDVRAADRLLMRELAPLVVSGSELSVFASETSALRGRSQALLDEALLGSPFAEEVRDILVLGLWVLQLGLLLYYSHDKSLGQRKTRDLVDGSLSLVFAVFTALGSPMLAPIRAQLRKVLEDAGLLG